MERLYLDRNFFRREKPQRGPEEKMMEKFELHIKQEQEQRKRMKHREFLSKMFEYSGKFFDFHKKKYTILKKRSNNVKQHIEWLRKKDQKELDKAERERIEAIKAQEFKEYGRLLAEAKNKRITQVLKETDTFLKDIGMKILDLKLKRSEFTDTEAEEMKELLAPPKAKLDENGEEEYDFSASTLMTENYQKFYYNLTHTKIEEVKEQPNLLEGGVLKGYQITGLQWLVSLYNNKLNGILADEMGLGKTIQTIALFCHIMEFKQNTGPFLIVVPLTTLTNWVMEFDKWAPSIKKMIYKGNPTQRKQISQLLRNSKWNVCLTTYEYIMKDKSDLNRFPWQYIVVDEGHKMKNPRSKFAQTLGQQYNSENRLLLTGTPLQNNLPELWSLLNFLLPKVFASCDDFEKWFKLPLKSFGPEKEIELNEEEKLLIIHRFHQALRPFLLRRVKKEVESELPNKIEYVIKVELSAWQKIVYDQIKQKECMAIDPALGKMGKRTLMNMMMQLRKICNHPYLFSNTEYEYNEDLIRCAGKFELLDRILPKLIRSNHRMLIFTQMTRLLDILQCFFTYRGYKFLRLDGTTKADDRADRMAMFNMPNSDYPIFMLSTRAGGLGLNLQTADTVILVDSDWNPQMDLQAQDRAHRIGSKSEVRVYRLVTNTVIEEEILSKASFKRNLDGMVIQAGLFNQKSTDVERRQRLEELIKKNQATDDSEEEEIPNDEEINHMLARSDQELIDFARWDQERYAADKPFYSDTGETNYRLMKWDNVPEWVKQAVKTLFFPKKKILARTEKSYH
jgi:ATP-dependent helicase STH1/SNF2